VWIGGGAHHGLGGDLLSLGHELLPLQDLLSGDPTARIDVVLIDSANEEAWGHISSWRSHLGGTPILLIADDEVARASLVRAVELGATGHLNAPLALPILDAWLRWAARRARRHRAPPQVVGVEVGDAVAPLRLDVARCSVFIHGRELLLTQGAFELLGALYRHRNRVLRRDWLLRTLCNTGDVRQTRALDVRIAVLRKALAPLALERLPRIETVRGVGYQLVV
jgi:DNA-binding response OmpR family regulator